MTSLAVRPTSRRRGRSGSSRRKLRWAPFTVFANSLANGGRASTSLVNTRSSRELIGSTVMGIRGVAGVRAAATTNMSAGSQVSIGVIVISVDASDAGPASIPSPFIDGDAPWMLYEEFIVQGLATNSRDEMESRVYRTKAKRKLLGNQVLSLEFANEADVSVDILVLGRVLLALP